MKNRIALLLLLAFMVSVDNFAQTPVLLPNGWKLSPAGRSLPLGDLPLNMAVSRSRKWIAVTNNGQSVQSIQLVDPVKEKVLDVAVLPKSWYGLAFSPDENSCMPAEGMITGY